jgi:hypothetical protein
VLELGNCARNVPLYFPRENQGKYKNAKIENFISKYKRKTLQLSSGNTRSQFFVRIPIGQKNAKLPQVVKSCIFHYEFEFIHPTLRKNIKRMK